MQLECSKFNQNSFPNRAAAGIAPPIALPKSFFSFQNGGTHIVLKIIIMDYYGLGAVPVEVECHKKRFSETAHLFHWSPWQ